MTGHPCERGRRCSCDRAGPSTPKKKLLLAAAALVCPVPVLGAPTPVLRTLERRVTDAGQAPDDPTEFTHEHIQLADLIRAGLPYKYAYDQNSRAWAIDNAWSLHGRRFGPLYATATAGITDDPLPTPTESIPPASTPTPTTTSSPPPTILAIQSSLPTGWDSTQYARSDMYAIPLVVSFALVIALMIGSLIGALVIRRDRSRSRRRKKRITQQDDDSREKVVQSSLVSRVGRALKHRDEVEEENPRTELEQRVKTWARRSAAWRAQARIGVRRRMGRGRRRLQADGPAMDDTIQEEPEPQEEPSPTPPTPARSRPPTPTIEPPPAPAVPDYSSPAVNYPPPAPYASPGPSTPLARLEAHPDATPSDEPAYDGPGSGDGLPPAYRGGGLSAVARGKRPAHVPVEEERREESRVWTRLDDYAFGENVTEREVTAHVATDDKQVLQRLLSMRGAPDEHRGEGEGRAPREEDVWSLSVPSSPRDGASSSQDGAPLPSETASAPSEFGASETGALPLPPSKTGTGPVARYGEADLSLPRYLDEEGARGGMAGVGAGIASAPEDMDMIPSAPEGMGMVPSAPEGMDMVEGMEMGMVPSAPPCEETVLPSAPPDLEVLPSAPPDLDEPVPTAPPDLSAPPDSEESVLPSAPPDSARPSAPPDSARPSAPDLDDDGERESSLLSPSAPPLPPNDRSSTRDDHPSSPSHDTLDPTSPIRRINSSSPLLPSL
ncbi:unnamed protein product [Rhizoctonia solani]|uniref:Transmembrane protein n=1 Tax=Rhizoctonia solani TaxID=456999 RepID=A0A8H3HV81_9AGAM|nr:unnamed protein product [Rhizoctonia solani]